MGNLNNSLPELSRTKSYSTTRKFLINSIVRDIINEDGRFNPSDNRTLILFNSIITQEDYDVLYDKSVIKPFRENIVSDELEHKISECRALLAHHPINVFDKIFPHQTNVLNIN